VPSPTPTPQSIQTDAAHRQSCEGGQLGDRQVDSALYDPNLTLPDPLDSPRRTKRANILAQELTLICPIRGRLKARAKGADGLRPSEEKLRIEAIRHLISERLPKGTNQSRSGH
jgi:hypothetical protein